VGHLEIRQAVVSDAAGISKIWNYEIRTGVSTFNSVEKTEVDILHLIENTGAATQVAYKDGSLLGFVTYGPFRNGVGYAHSKEHTIYLAKEARGRGVGRALMARICDVAKAHGVHALMAGIGGENSAGIAFHESLGFRHVATVPEVGRKFGRWMDLVLMQKLI
jgi:phosphinothricin acetyltransferase